MVYTRISGDKITENFWHQEKIKLRVEVGVIERRGAYRRRHFEGWNDLIPQIGTGRVEVSLIPGESLL